MSKILNYPFHTRYIVYLPSNLNLDNILSENPIEVTYNQGNANAIKDRAAYLLGQIYNAKQKLIANDESTDRWVRLSGVALQTVVKNYKQYMKYFEERGVIEHENDYSNSKFNSKSSSYAFTEKYAYPENWKNYIIYEPGFLKAIYKYKRPKSIRTKYHHLYKWLSELKIDFDEARLKLETLHPEEQDTTEFQMHLLGRLRNENLWTFKTCSTNRLFTPITNLKKEIRRMLTYKGELLYEIDIRNSIPYFSLTLLNNDLLCNNPIINKTLYDNCPNVIRELTKARPTHIGRDISGGSIETDSLILNSTYIMLGKNINLDRNYSDIKFFKEKVLNITIYEFLRDKWNDELGLEYTRDTAKKKLLAILNSPSHHKCGERDFLVETFPNVMKIFDKVNQGFFRTKGGKGKAKWRKGDVECPFAKVTQKLEAWFVLDIVCKKVSELYPDAPLYTVHDSVATTEEYVYLIKNIIETTALEIFKSPIEVKIKGCIECLKRA